MANTNDSNHVKQKVAAGLNLRQKFSSGNLFVALLILLLVGMPGTGLSKTLKRSCKGAKMVQYEIDGKKYTYTEPYIFMATGTSKGAVPSPRKARKRACKAAAQKAASAANRDRLLKKVCAIHPNATGRILFLGGIGRDKGEKKTHRIDGTFSHDFRCQGGKLYKPPVCGNGRIEGIEECDDGLNNSDTLPNKCRTDCRLPRCGDYVTDNGEECDDGTRNSNEIPDACRSNCKEPYCGDGVVDHKHDEKCDDGNSDPNDGCHNCQY